MVEDEDRSPTFRHPDYWSQLTTEEKADQMVILNQFKIISIAGFSSHYFKEISSLNRSIEETLNKDLRLDKNKPAEKRPPLENVLEEIKKNRTRNNKHQNDQEDAFEAKSPNHFPLLGIITRRSNHLMSVKGKPISLKSRYKGAIDVTIRNPGEFSNFLDQGKFQRQHMSSLLSQCFDPCFTFNSVYHNVARLINRRVIKSLPNYTMPMTHRVHKDHYPLLRKLGQLFFETQKLSARRNLLIENTSISDMKNYLLGLALTSSQQHVST